jgi:hypothetical protein
MPSRPARAELAGIDWVVSEGHVTKIAQGQALSSIDLRGVIRRELAVKRIAGLPQR